MNVYNNYFNYFQNIVPLAIFKTAPIIILKCFEISRETIKYLFLQIMQATNASKTTRNVATATVTPAIDPPVMRI